MWPLACCFSICLCLASGSHSTQLPLGTQMRPLLAVLQWRVGPQMFVKSGLSLGITHSCSRVMSIIIKVELLFATHTEMWITSPISSFLQDNSKAKQDDEKMTEQVSFVVCIRPMQFFHGSSKKKKTQTLTIWFVNTKGWEKPVKWFCLTSCLIKTTELHPVISAWSPIICGSKQNISTNLLPSFDVRMSNEVLTTSCAVKNWLFYRVSADLQHCITCRSLLEDTKVFMCFYLFNQNSQIIKMR